jgi:hypothetical protein
VQQLCRTGIVANDTQGVHAPVYSSSPVPVCLLPLQGWQACVDGVKELIDGEGGNHAVVEQCADVVSRGGGGQRGARRSSHCPHSLTLPGYDAV